jgi:hypothetical protein
MDEALVIAAVSVTVFVIRLLLLNRLSEVHELGINVDEVTKALGEQGFSPRKFRVESGH